jgi:hypothetical protein
LAQSDKAILLYAGPGNKLQRPRGMAASLRNSCVCGDLFCRLMQVGYLATLNVFTVSSPATVIDVVGLRRCNPSAIIRWKPLAVMLGIDTVGRSCWVRNKVCGN